MKLEFFRQIFDKYSNIKFCDSLSSRSRMVPRGQTDRTKLTVTLCSCVYVPNNSELGPGTGPKHVRAPVWLILCHSFKPIFFNLGLVSLFECVCPNCRWFWGKYFHIWKTWVYQHHISGYFNPFVWPLLFLCPIKHHAMKMWELRYRSTHYKPGH